MSAIDRRTRLRSAFSENLDGILLTSLVNVRWATGFSGSNGAALVTSYDDGWLATDGRYRLRAATEAPDVELLTSRALAPDLIAKAAATGVVRLGIEADHVTLSQAPRLREAATAVGVELVECRGLVERCRTFKDDAEIASLRTACEITDAVFDAVLTKLRAGLTERDLDWLLISTMRELGAEGPSFDAIVATGPNSAIPHHSPTGRPVQPGDFVKFDFGAMVEGYHADMTRTVVVGAAADWQREVYGLVASIQAELRAAAVTGAIPADLDRQAADLIREQGHEPQHGLGHGVGLEIHEEPWLTSRSSSPALVAGTPVTVEPGIYLDGRGGVRIEDSTIVTDHGAQPLTRSSRELLEV